MIKKTPKRPPYDYRLRPIFVIIEKFENEKEKVFVFFDTVYAFEVWDTYFNEWRNHCTKKLYSYGHEEYLIEEDKKHIKELNNMLRASSADEKLALGIIIPKLYKSR